jgi:DNA-binding beta-propeller fold protein YncE
VKKTSDSLLGFNPSSHALQKALMLLRPLLQVVCRTCIFTSLLILQIACSDRLENTMPVGASSRSSPITLSSDERGVWVVNPDADSITRVDTSTLIADSPIGVGHEPWSVGVNNNGMQVVLNRADGTLTLLEGSNATTIKIGAEPGGVALSNDGQTAFVTVSAQDEVAVINLNSRILERRIPVGRMPWAVAVASDGTVVVSHRRARLRPGKTEATNDGKEAWLSLIRGSSISEVNISPYAFGYANGLEGLAITDNKVFVSHLLNSPELPRDFETTVSGALSTVSLTSNQELTERRLHINETEFSTPVNFPIALSMNARGDRAYIVLAGTDAVMGVNLEQPLKPKLIGFWGVGSNPRGIVINQAGTRAYVMNYLSRDVSVLDLANEVSRTELKRIKVVPETLEPPMLRGKILFHKANDPRLSHLGWLSCASCHFDGGVDGTTWVSPDGLRQTQPLWKLEGTAPFHASATRDEVQDFEHDIEGLMDGIGLAPGIAARELGTVNANRSEDLDALAKYVLQGIRVPNAPENLDLSIVTRGRQVFSNAGCQACHGGEHWTVSHLPGVPGTLAPNNELEVVSSLIDVGTISPGDVLGAKGFDVPTLMGLGFSAPYLHDGSASNLDALFTNIKHVGQTLSLEDRADLIAFLKNLDAKTTPIAP